MIKDKDIQEIKKMLKIIIEHLGIEQTKKTEKDPGEGINPFSNIKF